MIDLIQSYIDELRKKVIVYEFTFQEEEIIFFKELKPQVLSKQLYFNKIYNIESKFPTSSNEAVKRYLNEQLHSLEYYFNRYLDFHQYYRSGSTYRGAHYFLRGRQEAVIDVDICPFDEDFEFSTGYNQLVARIVAMELLYAFLSFRRTYLQRTERER